MFLRISLSLNPGKAKQWLYNSVNKKPTFHCGSNHLNENDTAISVSFYLVSRQMEIHVETRLLANYVQTLSTLIGQIISKLINDAESDINFSLLCVDKFHVKSCFRTVCVLWTKNRYENAKYATTTSQILHFLVTSSLKMHLKMI